MTVTNGDMDAATRQAGNGVTLTSHNDMTTMCKLCTPECLTL